MLIGSIDITKLNHNSINQYKIEVRSIVARRIISSGKRLNELVKIMKKQTLTKPENLKKWGIDVKKKPRRLAKELGLEEACKWVNHNSFLFGRWVSVALHPSAHYLYITYIMHLDSTSIL